MVVELPSGRTVSGQNSLSCRALMEADMTGSYDATLTKGLEGKISAGSNAVSSRRQAPYPRCREGGEGLTRG
jgi:hypothetical protein